MIKFKPSTTHNLEQEFKDQLDSNIPAMVEDLAQYVYKTFNVPFITVTGVIRTKAEQEAIYGVGTTRTSPHMLLSDGKSHACDIRAMDTNVMDAAVAYMNAKYDLDNGFATGKDMFGHTMFYHELNNAAGQPLGLHVHLQYIKKTDPAPAKKTKKKSSDQV